MQVQIGTRPRVQRSNVLYWHANPVFGDNAMNWCKFCSMEEVIEYHFYSRLRLFCSVLRASKFSVFEIEWNCNFVGLLHNPFWLQLIQAFLGITLQPFVSLLLYLAKDHHGGGNLPWIWVRMCGWSPRTPPHSYTRPSEKQDPFIYLSYRKLTPFIYYFSNFIENWPHSYTIFQILPIHILFGWKRYPIDILLMWKWYPFIYWEAWKVYPIPAAHLYIPL